MPSQKFLFIINPVAGGKPVQIQEMKTLIEAGKPTGVAADIKIWETLEQGPDILNMILAGGYHRVAAVGGDGTINFVAGAAIQAGIPIGIIPKGSGNGLARHLGIPLSTQPAIDVFFNGREISIDTGTINGRLFLCTAGAGFDALIGHLFSTSSERGFFTYAKMTLQQLARYKPREYRVVFDGKDISTKAFLIAFANVNQYGNNTYIAPQADLQDGYLDICIIKPFHALQLPGLALRIFNRTITRSPGYEFYKAKKITLYLDENDPVHYDGEPIKIGPKLDIEVQPNNLKVIVGL